MNPDKDAFLEHYSPFYDKADQLDQAFQKPEGTLSQESLVKNKQTSLQIITTFHRILFGLDEKQKSKAITYQKGALEIILSLSKSVDKNYNEKDMILETLKATKCCVVRCSIGRNRCRAAGVFSYLQAILEKRYEDETLMDQALTVLAAISLNNDLNALQASVQMKGLITKASETHPKSSQIKKMSTYLNALFDTVTKEQEVNEKIHSSGLFFEHLENAQKLEIQATRPSMNQDIVETTLSTALKELTIANSAKSDKAGEFSMDTLKRKGIHPLLKDIVGDMYQKRSLCRYNQTKYKDAIEDAEKAILCVEGDADAVEKAEKVKISAMVELKHKDAEDEIAKAKLFVTDLKFLEEMLSKIQLDQK